MKGSGSGMGTEMKGFGSGTARTARMMGSWKSGDTMEIRHRHWRSTADCRSDAAAPGDTPGGCSGWRAVDTSGIASANSPRMRILQVAVHDADSGPEIRGQRARRRALSCRHPAGIGTADGCPRSPGQ